MQVSQGEEYLALSVDELSPILNRDELFVESEEQIFEAAMRWLEHDPDREQYSARYDFSIAQFFSHLKKSFSLRQKTLFLW